MASFEAIVAFSNVDLQDYDTLEALAEHLPNASWEQRDEDSIIVAVREAPSATIAVEEIVRLVKAHFPSADTPRVLHGEMTTAEIAMLAGVHRETARLWGTGQRRAADFPRPAAVFSPGMKVWAASDVYAWLRAHGISCPPASPLTMAQVVDANRQLECFALTHSVLKITEWPAKRPSGDFKRAVFDNPITDRAVRTERAVLAVR